MKLSRRYQPRCDYWYCARGDCPEGLTGSHERSEAEARAHVEQTGHEARVVKTAEIILRPAELVITTRSMP